MAASGPARTREVADGHRIGVEDRFRNRVVQQTHNDEWTRSDRCGGRYETQGLRTPTCSGLVDGLLLHRNRIDEAIDGAFEATGLPVIDPWQ